MGATAAMVQMEAVGERGKAGAGGAAGQAGSCSPGPEGDGAAMLGGGATLHLGKENSRSKETAKRQFYLIAGSQQSPYPPSHCR